MKSADVIPYGWSEDRVTKDTACFSHPDKPVSALVISAKNPVFTLPGLRTLSDTKPWKFAVVNTSEEEIVEEKYTDEHSAALERLQEYLESNRVD